MTSTHDDQPPSPAVEPAGSGAGQRRRPGRTRVAIGAALVAVGLVGGGGYALASGSSSPPTTASTAVAATSGSAPTGSATTGSAPAGTGMFTPPVSGTVTAVSASSITVQTTTGTITCTVNSDTTVQDNGAPATVSALKVGDTVKVFTGAGPDAPATATDDSTRANRILAGTSATQGPGADGFAGPGDTTAQAPTGTTSGTGAATTSTST